MSIVFDSSTAQLASVNGSHELPEYMRLVRAEVPVVSDQCLVHRSLVFDFGPDTEGTDRELRSNPLYNGKKYLRCGEFSVRINKIERRAVPLQAEYKEVHIHYVLLFYAYYLDACNKKRRELYEINRTEYIPRLYCPEEEGPQNSYVLPFSQSGEENSGINAELTRINARGHMTRDVNQIPVLDISLDYTLSVKCKRTEQLFISAYDLKALEEIHKNKVLLREREAREQCRRLHICSRQEECCPKEEDIAGTGKEEAQPPPVSDAAPTPEKSSIVGQAENAFCENPVIVRRILPPKQDEKIFKSYIQD